NARPFFFRSKSAFVRSSAVPLLPDISSARGRAAFRGRPDVSPRGACPASQAILLDQVRSGSPARRNRILRLLKYLRIHESCACAQAIPARSDSESLYTNAGDRSARGCIRVASPYTAMPRAMAPGLDRALLAEDERSPGLFFSAGRPTLLETPDRVRRPSPPRSLQSTRRLPRPRKPERVEDPLYRRIWDTNTLRIRRSRAAG